MVVTRTRARLLLRLDPWAPPVVLMAVIFVLSAQPDLSTGLGVWDFIGRKIVHMTEYGLLCFLWWRALRRVTATPRIALALAFSVSLAYAGTDELHQTFVHGRHGTPVDVAIDAAGMAVACAVPLRRERA
jgi:VanZ family protein